MRSYKTILALVLVFSLIAVNWVLAQSMRCGKQLVRRGDSMPDVLSKCGEPQFRYKGTRSGAEIWGYNPGLGNFSYALTFRGGAVDRIEKSGDIRR
jgi:hypothetical protein